MVSTLSIEEFLDIIGTFIILGVRFVIYPAVCHHSAHVSHEQLLSYIIHILQTFGHCLQI